MFFVEASERQIQGCAQEGDVWIAFVGQKGTAKCEKAGGWVY